MPLQQRTLTFAHDQNRRGLTWLILLRGLVMAGFSPDSPELPIRNGPLKLDIYKYKYVYISMGIYRYMYISVHMWGFLSWLKVSSSVRGSWKQP